jgi:hypothetical protein
VRDLAHITDSKRHSLVKLELIHRFVVSHVQERLPVHLQDLVADLKHTATMVTPGILKMDVCFI